MILLLWEVLATMGLYDVRLLPRPTSVVTAIGQMANEGILWQDIISTFLRVLTGFFIGTTVGFVVGLITGLTQRLRRIVEPIVQVARPIPAVSLIPLAIVWFGVGEVAKLFIVGWACFFPVWVNTHSGVQRVPKEFLWSAAVLGADNKRIVSEVIVPWSLPFVQAGMRVSVGLAFAATVVAEMSGASAGLGFRIITSHLLFQVDRMIGSILLIGALGALIDRLFVVITRRLLPWLDAQAK
jgi:NitT/TauT family transport system permease protein